MLMRRNGLVLTTLLALVAVLTVAGCTNKGSTTVPTTTPPPTTVSYTLSVASNAAIGTYLVDGKGMTLYYHLSDTNGKSTASASDLSYWPPFNPPSFVLPQSLKQSDCSRTNPVYGGNKEQATYKGWPLYYYVGDKKVGDAFGRQVAGWGVVDPNQIKQAP